MTLGEMIEELRKDKGLQQKDLADLLNVSRSTISNYESDIHCPDIDRLIKLADIFGVSVDYIIGRMRFDFDLKKLNKGFVKIGKKEIITDDLLNDITKLSDKSKILLIEYIV